jgi:alpha-beta hydrolase superfamily lysophospholipase/SAM-dependent methyltransferase
MQMTEHTMRSWDDAQIFYRVWMPPGPVNKALLLFHRGHEHSGRWEETVQSLNLEGCAVFAWDQRGHGQSAGERGHAPGLAAVIKDADVFARHVCQEHGVSMRDMVVIAHSVGAVIASAWVHDYGPPIRGLVLVAPALRVKLYVPLAVPMLRLKQKCLGPGTVTSYVKPKMLTHDPRQATAYRQDPLIFRQIAVNILLDLHDTSTRLLDDAGAITTPTLILAADKDWIVKMDAQQEFYRRLGSAIKQFEVVPNSYHSLFHETARAGVVARIHDFTQECFASVPVEHALCDADKSGYTRTEYDLLRSPGPLRWRAIRAGLNTFGRLSRGVSLGWKSGFDSGATLDYVYRNQSAGITPLGRLVDYFYLNSIGWRGIRVRRENLQKALRQTILRQHQAGEPVRIMDIASGPGRYVLETMQTMPTIPICAVLRDYRQENLDAGMKLAKELAITQATFMRSDAFDRESLAQTSPAPTLAVVSGLYELFPDNALIRQSLQGIYAAMKEGGYLVYTCQPWHPQVEFIARVLTNREGEPWIMRRRTQAEMDQLVSQAGFEKISQDIDPWGIFSVSVARRVMA